MRMILLILGALCMLGGGAAGAYFYFGQEAEASSPETEHAEADAQATTKAKGHGEEGSHLEPSYVDINAIILPIVDASGLNQVITISVSLEIGNEADAERVRAMTPKLKNAFLRDMYGVFSRYASAGGVIETDYIKARLGKITHKVMGDDSVSDVLLRVVHQRPV